MKLPPRGKVGSKNNMRRLQNTAVELHKIGKLYREAVPKAERSYKRWMEFLAARNPLLAGVGTVEHYEAATKNQHV